MILLKMNKKKKFNLKKTKEKKIMKLFGILRIKRKTKDLMKEIRKGYD